MANTVRVELNRVVSDAEFTDFLMNKPLYYKFKAVEKITIGDGNYTRILDYCNKAFSCECPAEKNVQTFKTEVIDHYSDDHIVYLTHDRRQQPPEGIDPKTDFLNDTYHFDAKCQSCGYKLNYVVRTYTDNPWKDLPNLFIQKIGQFPAFSIEPEKELVNYLTEEDLVFYKKAKINLSQNYGIAAFAYFRRIIENEIKRLIKSVSELDFEGVEEVKFAYEKFLNDHQMSSVISVLNAHLPGSLKRLDGNPIGLLYQQVSEGIHDSSEELCVEKARSIDYLLTYIIRAINEENSSFKKAREAMLKLQNPNQ